MADTEERGKPVERKGRLTVVLVLATLIAAFGSSFQYGYNVSVVNSPSQFMQQFYNTTYMERYHSPMEENVLTLLWSLSVSMFPLGGFFGSLMVAPRWTLMLGLTGIPAAIQLLLLPFFPESPRYMLIQNGDEKKATKALQRLRGWDDVDSELLEMRQEDQSEKAEGHLSVFSLLSQRSLRWQLISIVVMNMGQQLSGVNAIYYYADSIYGSAGVRESDIQYVTVGTGAVNVFMTITAVFIVEASGRRLLLLCGFGICCGACVLLTVALNLQETVTWMPYVSIASVIIYVIGHAIGPSPIPYVVATEMFRQTARPAAFMVAGSVHWLSNFIVGLVFPFLERGLGPYSFIIFAVICLVTLIYIWLVVPETKKKTFLEVFQMFAKRNKVELNLGDGDLPLKELKESPQDAQKATPF
ncbi:solute carrier family 2, facilitated glucose transporter member 5 [Haplochromis burtoni]|uniref:solute carrier family 2, facilitated glucose transporter member 5 n=1 Tax=Haplochromis burtoni TaxID=8153 RepID=UPI001C2DBAC2|nr:solute carrier family 2, facilitated glucose transporter member 5 [Haplochromis burtoni]